MPQIQYFHDFIFEDHWPDFVNDFASRNKFQGLHFRGMHITVSAKIAKFMFLENLYEYGILFYWHVGAWLYLNLYLNRAMVSCS